MIPLINWQGVSAMDNKLTKSNILNISQYSRWSCVKIKGMTPKEFKTLCKQQGWRVQTSDDWGEAFLPRVKSRMPIATYCVANGTAIFWSAA